MYPYPSCSQTEKPAIESEKALREPKRRLADSQSRMCETYWLQYSPIAPVRESVETPATARAPPGRAFAQAPRFCRQEPILRLVRRWPALLYFDSDDVQKGGLRHIGECILAVMQLTVRPVTNGAHPPFTIGPQPCDASAAEFSGICQADNIEQRHMASSRGEKW